MKTPCKHTDSCFVRVAMPILVDLAQWCKDCGGIRLRPNTSGLMKWGRWQKPRGGK